MLRCRYTETVSNDMEQHEETDAAVLNAIALAIDGAEDRGEEVGLRAAIQLCDEVEPDLAAVNIPLLLYFRANAYSALLKLSRRDRQWDWREPDLEAQIFDLRRAAAHQEFAKLAKPRRLQVLTNLGNCLNHLGRSIEALEVYDRALTIDAKFGMALGNLGLARSYFARSLFDRGHVDVGMMLADEALRATQSGPVFWDSINYQDAKRTFAERADWIEERLDVKALRKSANLEKWSLGQSKAERTYRTWALRNRLFINPLNVLGVYPIGAADVLTLPSHQTNVGDPPQYIAWFNQMVQEFVAARLFFYEGAVSGLRHFADRNVTLIDTLDYPAFSISVEKIRLSFRSTYSLLDKIAGFLNRYLNLGIAPEQVTIRTLWHDKKMLRQQFETRPNWHLRGLYWLSRDIADDYNDDAKSALEPEARELKKLRRVLEHRCLVFRDIDVGSMGIVETTSLAKFEAQTLKLLKLVRAALIHLALAVHQEERERAKGKSGILMGSHLPTYHRSGYP